MIIDREVQRLIMDTLMTSYPDYPPFGTFNKLIDKVGDGDKLVANMLYLEERKLIRSGLQRSSDGHFSINEAGFITADGIDFLADDGGLKAILDTVNIKIHDDTLARLSEFIEKSDLNPQDKSGYVAGLKELPAETTKHLVLKLVDYSIQKGGPEVLQLLQKFLGF